MGGGLMQLVAYGAQDVYLTGNPQITFFKVVYRRHTNFAMESIEQTFNGTSDFGKRVTATISRNGDLISNCVLEVTVPTLSSTVQGNNPVTPEFTDGSATTIAHLATLAPVTLAPVTVEDQTELARAQTVMRCAIERGHARWVKYLGHYIIKSVEVEIGGQRVDKHYGHWLQVWYELTRNCCQDDSYHRMIGHTTQMNNPGSLLNLHPQGTGEVVNSDAGSCHTDNAAALISNTLPAEKSNDEMGSVPSTTLYIPLQFWFNRNPGLALPLIALQYHEVKINFEFEAIDNLTLGQVKTDCCRSMEKCSLYVDYVYLDTDERRRFAQVSHEYLIEQLQFTGDESISSSSNKTRLNFNHPVKELIWTCSTSQTSSHKQQLMTGGSALSSIITHSAQKDYANVTTNPWDSSKGGNPTANGKLQLNGHDRFSERKGDYFNHVQPWQHHSNSPSVGINVYSFAVKPEEHQPSGTCNFSRIDNATLILTVAGIVQSNTTVSGSTNVDYTLRVYAVNYNVLRIMSGMGGLAYSN